MQHFCLLALVRESLVNEQKVRSCVWALVPFNLTAAKRPTDRPTDGLTDSSTNGLFYGDFPMNAEGRRKVQEDFLTTKMGILAQFVPKG